MPSSTDISAITKLPAEQVADAAKAAANSGFTAAKGKEVLAKAEDARKLAEAATQLAYETAKQKAAEAAAARQALYIKIGLAVVGIGLAAYFLYFKKRSGESRRESNPAQIRRARSGSKKSRAQRRRDKEEALHRDMTGIRGTRKIRSKVDESPRHRRKGRALTPAQRQRLPLKEFVFPERRAWPIHDERHALIAIRYMQMGRGRELDYPKIIRAIKRRYGMNNKVMHALSKFK